MQLDVKRQISEMAAAGVGHSEIARQLGVSRQLVFYHLKAKPRTRGGMETERVEALRKAARLRAKRYREMQGAFK